MKRVVKHPKGYLRDSGLLHALLRIPDAEALLSHPQMGASWEGMVVEEILRQLNTLGVGYEYSYYRTGGGAEVDLVVEGNFGRVAVEIKHTSTVGGRDLRGLGISSANTRRASGWWSTMTGRPGYTRQPDWTAIQLAVSRFSKNTLSGDIPKRHKEP